jgi:hypothetical protein
VNKLVVLALLIGLAACSKKKPEEGREPVQPATPGVVVGSAAGAPPAGAAASGSAAAAGSSAAPAPATAGGAEAGGSGSAAPH